MKGRERKSKDSREEGRYETERKGQLYELVFELRTTRISIRLYGGALLSVSLIMWKGLYTAEKAIIQWTLLTEACLFAVQFLVLFLIITLLYYYHLGRRTKKTQNHTHSSD
ncbi:unnamed protein product [Coregonus sp. 'balchen']|nr:unnamed protein product [Coregonus sp. 'balchen']